MGFQTAELVGEGRLPVVAAQSGACSTDDARMRRKTMKRLLMTAAAACAHAGPEAGHGRGRHPVDRDRAGHLLLGLRQGDAAEMVQIELV